MKVGSIRSHRKYRTGCKNCKRRKIRCDEQKPSCVNCIKHSIHCDFPSSTSALAPATSSLSPSSPSDAARPSSAIPQSSSPLLEPNILDLELMHNYVTSTAPSFNDNFIIRAQCQLAIPRLCLSYPFLMRTILALSALHIAHFTPSRRGDLISYALEQYQVASQKAGKILANVTEENCVALYVFSVLTYMFAMATPTPLHTDDFLFVSDAGVADWIYLLRGTREIITMYHTQLSASEFGPMFTTGSQRYMLHMVDASPHMPLAELQCHLETRISDKKLLGVYKFAIEEMRKTFGVVNASSKTELQVTDISIWAFTATDEYLALLKARDNAALVILAFFCVLIRKFECHWWMQGRSAHILGSIYRLVDDEYRLLMRWPMEENGWLPPTPRGLRGEE